MEAHQGGGGEVGRKGQGGGGEGAQGAGGGGGGGPGGPMGPPGSGMGQPPPRMWRGGRRQGKGTGRRTRRRGRKGGSGAGGRSEGQGEAEGARRTASPSPELTSTYRDSESPQLRRYAPPPVRRGPGTVARLTEGEVAELARYVKWAGKTRGRREKSRPRPFSDLVSRAGRPRERGPEMDEGRWKRMLGAALPRCAWTVPRRRGRSPGFRCCESYCSGRGGTVVTRRAGQEQEREVLEAGGQGRAEGRADGMRGGGRGGSAEVKEGEEGM